MKILIVSLHVRHSAQAVALAAGNLKAALPQDLRQTTQLLDLYLQQSTLQMLEEINAAHADLIAFSLYLWNRAQILELADALKKQSDSPFVLAGGPEASADSSRLLASGLFNAVLRGEGEESFPLLVKRFSDGNSLAGLAGVCTDSQHPPAAACCCDIEQLKSPWLSHLLEPSQGGVLWEVARGCPFNCSFCYDAKGMAGVRPLPHPRLVSELELFVHNGVEQVWVLDSTFNAPPKRGQKLLRMLIEKAPELHYHLEAKADFIDAKTIELLSQLSCSIQLGLQSADTEVLAGLNRKINPQRFWAGVELLANSRLTFGLDLIYGLPGDSYGGFTASLGRILHYRPNQIDIFPLALLPGTSLYEQKKSMGLIADDQPPYLLQQSNDFSAQQMRACALLTAAVDLFYNRGRAVGFMLPFCTTLKISLLSLLTSFRDWFIKNMGEEKLLTSKNQSVSQILQLQQDFIQQMFKDAGQHELLPLVADILNYHYYYAESLMSDETLPASGSVSTEWTLQLAKGVHLIDFRCDILGALEEEEIDLQRWTKLVDRTPTTVLMFRRGHQVFSELLTDEFTEILLRAQKGLTGHQLIAGMPQEESLELLEFALQEGILEAT